MNAMEKVFSIKELLDRIFSFGDFTDLQSARAVCKIWYETAELQMNKRAHINLGTSNQVAKMICTLDPKQFTKFTVTKRIPKSFEIKFGAFLTGLYLKDVTFCSLNHFRLVVFEVFPSMTELALFDPKLSPRPNAIVLNLDTNRIVNNITKVRKLTVLQNDTSPVHRHLATDLFLHFSIEELVQNYSETLKELHCPYLTTSCKNSMRDLFTVLAEQQVRLTDLNFCFNRAAEVETFRNYGRAFGDQLKTVELSGFPTFNRLFVDLPVSNLQVIRDHCNKWQNWKGAELDGLRELVMGIGPIESFHFLRKMPNLKIIQMGLNNEKAQWQGAQSTSVHTLKLKFFGDCEPLTRLAMVFPNLKTVEIEVSHKNHSHNGGQCPLQNVANVWPGLEHVKLLGYFDSCLSHKHYCDDGSDQGWGNENLYVLRKLLKLKDLRSFVCNDEKSPNIFWGDDAATAIFLKMPELRILRIGICTMSDSIVDRLKEKLQLFTYLKRV